MHLRIPDVWRYSVLVWPSKWPMQPHLHIWQPFSAAVYHTILHCCLPPLRLATNSNGPYLFFSITKRYKAILLEYSRDRDEQHRQNISQWTTSGPMKREDRRYLVVIFTVVRSIYLNGTHRFFGTSGPDPTSIMIARVLKSIMYLNRPLRLI